MDTMTRTLVLLRHAKARSWSTDDHSRELEPRGRRAAADAGQWLAAQGFAPDLALVSSAARTMATWEELAEAAGFTCAVEASDAVYTAEPDSALDLIRAAPPEVGSLIMVGHNPTISHLAQLLDDGEGDPETGATMMVGFAPSGAALLTWTGTWAELAPGGATLIGYRPGQH